MQSYKLNMDGKIPISLSSPHKKHEYQNQIEQENILSIDDIPDNEQTNFDENEYEENCVTTLKRDKKVQSKKSMTMTSLKREKFTQQIEYDDAVEMNKNKGENNELYIQQLFKSNKKSQYEEDSKKLTEEIEIKNENLDHNNDMNFLIEDSIDDEEQKYDPKMSKDIELENKTSVITDMKKQFSNEVFKDSIEDVDKNNISSVFDNKTILITDSISENDSLITTKESILMDPTEIGPISSQFINKSQVDTNSFDPISSQNSQNLLNNNVIVHEQIDTNNLSQFFKHNIITFEFIEDESETLNLWDFGYSRVIRAQVIESQIEGINESEYHLIARSSDISNIKNEGDQFILSEPIHVFSYQSKLYIICPNITDKIG